MIDAIIRWALVLFIVVIGHSSTSVFSTPVWNPQVVNGGFGRNIRHLPCVSRRTGETGVCMFAYSCAKTNGTHLGTCIDRFYFGSCCKVPTSNLDLAAPLDNNNISEESVLSLSSTENYLLSTYQSVQLVKNTSVLPDKTSTATLTPDILPPVRKPSKPQITSTKLPSNTEKPPSLEVLIVSSTTPVFSKTTESPYTVEISTTQSPITSIINNYFKPTKKPPINQNVSLSNQTLEKPRPKPTLSPPLKPNLSYNKPVSQPVTKPSKPTITPVSSYNKPSLSQPETKPTSPPIKPVFSTKPKPQIPITSTNKIKPTLTLPGNKPNNSSSQATQRPITKPPSLSVTKPATVSTSDKFNTGPPVKVPKPSQKPLLTSKPTTSSKPVNITKPTSSKPVNITKPTKPLVNLTTESRPQNNSKPVLQTKPTLPTKPSSATKPSLSTKPLSATKPSNANKPSPTQKPIISSKPTTKPSSPTYVKIPLTSTPIYNKVTVTSTTISNEVLPELGNFSTVSSIEFEEEVSNLINGSPSPPTDVPPALVTWTTVDEVPVKPIKPVSTPIGPANTQNKTKIPVSPTISSVTNSEAWVEVSVSTHEPSQSEPGELGSTKPNIISTSTAKPVTSATTTNIPPNTTNKPTSTINVTTLSPSTSTEGTTSSTASTSPSTVNLVNSTTETYLGLQSNYTDNEIETTLLNTSNFVDVCGRRLFPQSRIVGGDKATFGKWPWQISLRQWRTSTYLHKCGAALLNENWAITAAHCVENVPPSDLLLRLGEHDLSLEDEPYGYQERRVQIVASHPQFDSRTFEYDLALLRFYEPVTFQPNVIPVCVPQDDTNFVGSTAYVTGWGRLYEDGPLPSVLQEVSVPVINNTVCETMYRAAGYIEHIPEIFICAGWKKGGFDSCEGDSGGPMVIQRPDRRWLLAGVISWGIGCAEPNQPGVYTRISEFREWINQILQF